MSKQTEVIADTPQTVTLTFDQLKELLAETRATPSFDAEAIAAATAKAHQELNKKENKVHPGVSAFSHPDGDVKHPRPVMRCDTYWYGDKITGDRHSYREMELANQVQPGEYLCSKPDGTKIPVTVSAKVDPLSRKFTRIDIDFRPEDGRNVLSMAKWLEEIVEQQQPAPVLATA